MRTWPLWPVDGNVAYSIVTAAATSADLAFHGLNPADVSVTNTDDDVLGSVRLYSAGTRSGNMGGRANIDAVCTAAAAGWAVGKTIHAFMSLGVADEIRDMPTNYALPTNLPIQNLAGTNTIANNWADLLDGNISMSLQGAGIVSNVWWSFSTGSGAQDGFDNCSNGTSGGADFGTTGDQSATHSGWIANVSGQCVIPFDVLCIAY